MSDNMFVETHVWHMVAHLNKLDVLSAHMSDVLKEDLILLSLPDSWENFIMKFIQLIESLTLKELMAMLKAAEPGINSRKRQKDQIFQALKKGKGKKGSCPKTFRGV